MNKDLQGMVYDIPQNILNQLQQQISQQSSDPDGVVRARNLIYSGKVNYNQLKRILHDMKYINKELEPERYNLYGGKALEDWGWTILTGDRTQIQNNKVSRENADNNGGINGMRANAHNVTHTKKDSFIPNVGIKSNSEKSSISSLISEEINRIKELLK